MSIKEKIEHWKKKYPFLKKTASWPILISLFFTIWIAFFDAYSVLEIIHINEEINNLENNKSFYKEQIQNDINKIKKLNQIEEVEKFAREKYFMKRDSEDIYIIEIDKQYK